MLGSRSARRQIDAVLARARAAGAYSVGFALTRGALTGFTVYLDGSAAGGVCRQQQQPQGRAERPEGLGAKGAGRAAAPPRPTSAASPRSPRSTAVDGRRSLRRATWELQRSSHSSSSRHRRHVCVVVAAEAAASGASWQRSTALSLGSRCAHRLLLARRFVRLMRWLRAGARRCVLVRFLPLRILPFLLLFCLVFLLLLPPLRRRSLALRGQT